MLRFRVQSGFRDSEGFCGGLVETSSTESTPPLNEAVYLRSHFGDQG